MEQITTVGIGLAKNVLSLHGVEWARRFEPLGHTVQLTAPKIVTPYRKSGKNDGNDAEAICEALSRPSMRLVPVKSAEQQALRALHRVRQGLVVERTAAINRPRRPPTATASDSDTVRPAPGAPACGRQMSMPTNDRGPGVRLSSGPGQALLANRPFTVTQSDLLSDR